MPQNRHPALASLSRDHQAFLQEARRIRWLIENDERSGTLNEVVDALLLFWKNIGEAHLNEEEAVLFPAYLQVAPLSRRDVEALITDHNWLRDKLRELADLPRYENCSPLLTSLAEYIVNHIRLEEQVMYEKMQSAFSESQLEELEALSREYRLAHRGEEAHIEYDEDIEALL